MIRLRPKRVDEGGLREVQDSLHRHTVRLIRDRERLLEVLGQTTWARGSPAAHIHAAIVELHNAEVSVAQARRGK